MAGVFISHSSRDKDFVTQLAIDLVNRGFPVWLDTWRIGLGDQLNDEIFKGIDDSTFLVLVMSQSSIKSDWVNDELNAALEKEKQLGRTFALPIKIDDCKVPLKVAGRIHADFTQSYFSALDVLDKALKQAGADQYQAPCDKQLLPLQMDQGMFLNETALTNRLAMIRASCPKDFRLTSAQIVLSPDATYSQLRSKLLNTLERSRLDSSFGPEDIAYVNSAHAAVEKHEHALLDGVIDLLTRFADPPFQGYAPHMCSWYVRIVRTLLFGFLYRAQRTADGPIIDAPPSYVPGVFHGGPEQTAKFFGIQHARHFTVFRTDNAETCGVWIDGDSRAARELKDDPYVSIPLLELTTELNDKFIFPQLVFRSRFPGVGFSADWTPGTCAIRMD